jgi:sulfhydrogenase subunit delta
MCLISGVGENMKKKIAIFDLTDCEGCELQIVNLKGKLINFEKYFEFVDWRLVKSSEETDIFDITIVEGNPVKQSEEDLLKDLRSKTKVLIALGACAITGGIPSMINEVQRSKIAEKIYGKGYSPQSISTKPISSIVKIDCFIPGCPADISQIEQTLTDLYFDKTPTIDPYPVCLECKSKENKCLLLEGKPCLGPVTQGGCKAACPSGGLNCYGCWGPMKDANLKALYNVYKRDLKWSEDRTKKNLELFWKDLEEYKKSDKHH